MNLGFGGMKLLGRFGLVPIFELLNRCRTGPARVGVLQAEQASGVNGPLSSGPCSVGLGGFSGPAHFLCWPMES